MANEALEIEELLVPENDDQVWLLLRRVWDQYGDFKATALSAITHQMDTPWDITRKQFRGSSGHAVIDDNLIRKHYVQLGRKNNAAA